MYSQYITCPLNKRARGGVHRSRSTGLWLSELGGVLLSPDHAPAGTKRLSNLLLSPKLSSLLIDVFL
jgi:hypothetical protein